MLRACAQVRLYPEVMHESVVVHANKDGPVATIQSMPRPIPTNKDGAVVNSKGEVVAIVHQTDREKSLDAYFVEKYRGKF